MRRKIVNGKLHANIIQIYLLFFFIFLGKPNEFFFLPTKLSPLIILFPFCTIIVIWFSSRFQWLVIIFRDSIGNLPAVEFLETLNYTIWFNIFTGNLVFPWITGVVHFFHYTG